MNAKQQPFNKSLAADRFIDQIAVCEPRLALSASVAVDLLINTFAAGSFGIPPSSAPDPINDAAEIRSQYSLDGSGQSVAVIDSGIAWDHAAFANPSLSNPGSGGLGQGNRVVAGWDFAENDANPYDDGPAGFHGTHVAGILAGQAEGIAGIVPGADLVALRVFDDFGRSSLDWIESALRWVIDHRDSLDNPITAVNLSIGAFATDTSHPLTQLDDELLELHNDGIIVTAAAGNSFSASRPDALAYPASNPLVAAVTSVDTSGNIQDFAQRSSGVFAAPGSAVRGSVPDHVYGVDGNIDDYATLEGTSMASPQLAGASILVRQAMQSLGLNPTPDDILAHLRQTSISRTDAATGVTYDVLDLKSAIDTLLAGNDNIPSTITDEPSPLQWTDATTLHIQAGNNADRFVLNLTEHPSVTVNGVVYPIERRVESLTIDGSEGHDTLEIIGGTGPESVLARAALNAYEEPTANLQRPGLTADFNSLENVIFRGGGGNDRATFFDSPDDDTLEADATTATMRGMGYTFIATEVPNIYAHATHGGNDIAYLYGTSGNDLLAIRQQFSSLRSDDLFRLAYGFEQVYAFAGAGGNDHADLFDSAGDDRMSASATSVWISGSDYYAGAQGFGSVTAESSAGGHDYATLYAADNSGTWTRANSLLQWNLSIGSTISAQGFETTDGFVAGQRVEILPQSVRYAYHEDERRASRTLFASFDEFR